MTFETEDGKDEPKALQEACKTLERFEWMEDDLLFWFGQVEIKMAQCGVKKQFTKFQVLATIIPRRIIEEVKPLLRKTEADFTEKDSYKQLKTRILTIFGPKPEESVERALNRVMTTTPSALARALVNDLCKNELDCECCPAIVTALWKRHLSEAVRAGIAEYDMDKDNFDQLVALADKIHASKSKLPSVASLALPAAAAAATAGLDETQPAIPYATAEVAAVQRGGRGGRNFRGGRGGRGFRGGGRNNRGANNQAAASSNSAAGTGPKHKGTKHPDLPAGPWNGCSMHFRWGRGAHFCSEPGSCPWKNIFTPKE